MPSYFLQLPGYLGVSSPLRPLTCNDTPQVAIRSVPGAVVGHLLGPDFDIFKPGVSWPSSWSFSINFSFYCRCQNVIFAFYMTIVSAFSYFYFVEKFPGSA